MVTTIIVVVVLVEGRWFYLCFSVSFVTSELLSDASTLSLLCIEQARASSDDGLDGELDDELEDGLDGRLGGRLDGATRATLVNELEGGLFVCGVISFVNFKGGEKQV